MTTVNTSQPIVQQPLPPTTDASADGVSAGNSVLFDVTEPALDTQTSPSSCCSKECMKKAGDTACSISKIGCKSLVFGGAGVVGGGLYIGMVGAIFGALGSSCGAPVVPMIIGFAGVGASIGGTAACTIECQSGMRELATENP